MGWELIPAELLGAKLAHDFFSNMAKQAGEEVAKAGLENIKKVSKVLVHRLKVRPKAGKIPARVQRVAFEQALHCEDALQAEYLGGILASAKSRISRDDRAASYLAILDDLSCYQIRTHAIVYSAILRIKPEAFQRGKKAIIKGNCTIIIPEKDFMSAMDFVRGERPNLIIDHSLIGLSQRGLLRGIGPAKLHPRVAFHRLCFHGDGSNRPMAPFLSFEPTLLGIELFLWGIGWGDQGLTKYAPDILKRIKFPLNVIPSHICFDHMDVSALVDP